VLTRNEETCNLASRLTTEVLNGTTTTYQYDAVSQLTSDTSNAFSYDLNGNRTMTGYQTSTGNQLSNDGTWTYTYDAEGNLAPRRTPAPSSSPPATASRSWSMAPAAPAPPRGAVAV